MTLATIAPGMASQRSLYKDVNVTELVDSAPTYVGQRLTVTGTVIDVGQRDGKTAISLLVPVANEDRMEEVMVLYNGSVEDVSGGATLTAWGLGADVYIRGGFACGMTAIPLIDGEILEW